MESFVIVPEKVKHHGNHVASEDNTRYLVLNCTISEDWKLIPNEE